jgi:hypothetical protein
MLSRTSGRTLLLRIAAVLRGSVCAKSPSRKESALESVGSWICPMLSLSLILDKQVANNALKRLDASLEIGFLQECLLSRFEVSGHSRGV